MQVVHRLPGRLRLEIEEVYRRPRQALHLENTLLLKEGVRKARANAETGRLLVHYTPGVISERSIHQEIKRILSLPAAAAEKLRPLKDRPPEEVKAYELEKLPLASQFGLTAATGLLLFASYLRGEKPPPSASFNARNLLKANKAVTILLGIPIFRTALDHVFKKKLSTELLAGAASLSSLFLNDDRFGLSVLNLVYLNTLIRATALESVRDKIRAMLEGKNPAARLITKDGPIIVPGNQLAKNALFEVRQKERLPADGIVDQGGGLVNQFPTEGRLKPRRISPGDRVYAGSILQEGVLTVRAERVAEATKVGRLIEHLKDKGDYPDKKATRKLNQLSVVSLLIAGGYFLITKNFRGALNMLVIGMPGAAGLAKDIPAEIGAARVLSLGALVKGGKDLAALGSADYILVEDGSFLAEESEENREITDELVELGYKFPQVNVPNRRHLREDQMRNIIGLLRKWQKEGQVTALVGADLGEAPLLAAADVGITKACGDDLNLKSAEIILTGDDSRDFIRVAYVARRAKEIGDENSRISTGSSLLGYGLGIFNKLTPFWTGVIQNVSNLAILFNSGRLLLPLNGVAEPNGKAPITEFLEQSKLSSPKKGEHLYSPNLKQ